MTDSSCETVCKEIVEELIKKNLMDARKQTQTIQKLKNGTMSAQDWILLAELRKPGRPNE